MSPQPTHAARKILTLLTFGMVLGLAASQRAVAQSTVDLGFNFSLGASVAGHGIVHATVQGDGSMWATSGSFTLTSSNISGAPVGTYALTALGPVVTVYPVGNLSHYQWDDVIWPTSNPDGQLPNGIIFGTVAMWSASASDIALSTYSAGTNRWTDTTGGTLSVSAIPEPSTYGVLVGLGALGFAAYRRQRRPAMVTNL